MKNDVLLKALAADDTVRITAVSGADVVAEARRLLGLSRVASAALGRQLLMTLMMASELKNDTDRVSTILKGDGPAGTMICTGSPNLDVKGTTGDPGVELPPTARGKLDVSGYVGSSGRLTVVRDLSLKEPYVGSCALVSGEIAEDFASYYMVSQQQPSIVYLGVRVDVSTGNVRAAGGILVQPLPGCPDETIDRLQALAPEIASLAKRLDDGTEPERFVSDVFSGLGVRLVEQRVPRYRCDCSQERIERALISVGRTELEDMIHQDHGAEVVCHFCNRKYTFSEESLIQLLWRASKEEHGDRQ